MRKEGPAGKAIIVSAPSGAGKTSIVKYLMENLSDLDFSISATSRPPRENERDGVDYYFMSADKFREKIGANEFAEWEEVYTDRYYGTLRSEIERIWSLGKHIIFDVDVQGGLNLKSEFGDRAVSLFIKPPGFKELKERLLKRGTDMPGDIEIRLEKAKKEIKKAGLFDNIILNDKLDEACQEALELCKRFLNK